MSPSPPIITLCVSSPTSHYSSASYAYGVAGHVLISNQPLAEIAYLRQPPLVLPEYPSLPAAPPCFSDASPPKGSRLVFSGLAWLGGQRRHVTCQATSEATWLTNPDAGAAVVSYDGQQIALLLPAQDDWAALPLLLPALILALALRGVFCLHASAVVAGDQLLAFLGESGRGKSTLAAYLAPYWFQLVDDVLPLAAGTILLPFPQPLAHRAAPSAPPFAARPLSAAYLLDEGDLSLLPLPPTAAALALARHTVAATLFPPDLLARHFDFCACLATAIPVKRLHYPRSYTALPLVHQTLVADLSAYAPPRIKARSLAAA